MVHPLWVLALYLSSPLGAAAQVTVSLGTCDPDFPPAPKGVSLAPAPSTSGLMSSSVPPSGTSSSGTATGGASLPGSTPAIAPSSTSGESSTSTTPLTAAQSTAVIAALALSFNPPSTPPSNSNSRRNLFSRQSAVYPNIDGGVSSSCGESVPYFLLGDGALATSTGTFAAPAGADSAPFKPTANPGPNDIAGVWKQVGGTVEWTSPEFDGGQAVICIVSGAGSSGGITAYFHGTPPSDCTPLTFGAAPASSCPDIGTVDPITHVKYTVESSASVASVMSASSAEVAATMPAVVTTPPGPSVLGTTAESPPPTVAATGPADATSATVATDTSAGPDVAPSIPTFGPLSNPTSSPGSPSTIGNGAISAAPSVTASTTGSNTPSSSLNGGETTPSSSSSAGSFTSSSSSSTTSTAPFSTGSSKPNNKTVVSVRKIRPRVDRFRPVKLHNYEPQPFRY